MTAPYKYLPNEHQNGRGKFNLLDAILALHMSITGASDQIENEQEVVDWLYSRFNNWRSNKYDCAFDATVHGLLATVLIEWQTRGAVNEHR